MSLELKHASLEKKLKLAIIINIVFTIIEYIIGFGCSSLSLISDASQNLTDATSLLISLFAHKISKKSATKKKTFGYGRATIIAALVNGTILLFIAIFIFKSAYYRILNPEPVEGTIVMLVGFIGICVNASVATLFIKHKDDININSAFTNMIYDAIASLGALIAGIVIYTTRSTFIDPVISIVIGLMLIRSSWSILKTALDILFEGVPKNIDIDKVHAVIKSNSGIEDVEDLHVWAISSYACALSCKVVVDAKNLNQSVYLVKKVKNKLEKDFNIKHSTIEIETNITKGASCPINF